MRTSSMMMAVLVLVGCARVHEAPDPSADARVVGWDDAGSASLPPRPTTCPSWVPPVPTRQLSAGANHICALGTDGRVRCWGDGANGQLGDGRRVGSGTLIEAAGISDVRAISAGGGFTCAVLSDATLRCWGGLGVGPRPGGADGVASSTTPAIVRGLSDVVEVAGGGRLACALDGRGEVSCWGAPMGTGSCAAGCVAARIPGLSGVTEVDAGYSHACALDEDGAVHCWGANDQGQLGDGTLADSLTPVEVRLGLPATEIVTGDAHSCAILIDRTLRCWGDNHYGQLGDGTTNIRAHPVAIAGLEDVSRVAAGRHTCAIASGETWCWGENRYGELFDGTREPRSVPGSTLVEGRIDAHAVTTCSLDEDGVITCCGRVPDPSFWDRRD